MDHGRPWQHGQGLLSAVSCGWPLGHALAVLSDANKGLKSDSQLEPAMDHDLLIF